jgi:hypothetical protein
MYTERNSLHVRHPDVANVSSIKNYSEEHRVMFSQRHKDDEGTVNEFCGVENEFLFTAVA